VSIYAFMVEVAGCNGRENHDAATSSVFMLPGEPVLAEL